MTVERRLMSSIYRSMMRHVKQMGPLSTQLGIIVKTKIRQDYSMRYAKLTNEAWNKEHEIENRLRNTLNFLNNSMVGDGGMELKVLKGLIKFESTKAVTNKCRALFNEKTQIKNLRKYSEYRTVERSAFKESSEAAWWINKNGLLDNEFAFEYISVLASLKSDIDLNENYHSTILDYERVLIAFNEENELLL